MTFPLAVGSEGFCMLEMKRTYGFPAFQQYKGSCESLCGIPKFFFIKKVHLRSLVHKDQCYLHSIKIELAHCSETRADCNVKTFFFYKP